MSTSLPIVVQAVNNPPVVNAPSSIIAFEDVPTSIIHDPANGPQPFPIACDLHTIVALAGGLGVARCSLLHAIEAARTHRVAETPASALRHVVEWRRMMSSHVVVESRRTSSNVACSPAPRCAVTLWAGEQGAAGS